MGTCTGQGCVRKDGRRMGRGKAWRERVAGETVKANLSGKWSKWVEQAASGTASGDSTVH